jgi:hypothetical protein
VSVIGCTIVVSQRTSPVPAYHTAALYRGKRVAIDKIDDIPHHVT